MKGNLVEKDSQDEWVHIGRLGAPHGIKGEIKLFSLSDVPDRFEKLKVVWWAGDQGRPECLTVAAFRPGERFHLIRFNEVEGRKAASRLTNGHLLLPRSQRGHLPQGQYFIDDIIGLAVEDESGHILGQVVDIIQTGSNDIYEIRGEGTRELLLPACREVILNIDLEKKRIRVRVPEEY
jgi:16S rRNA processing protein RimM